MRKPDSTITTEELQQLRKRMMEATEAAISLHRHKYSQIRSLLCRITCGQVDIEDYYSLACNLADLLESMGPGTIFAQYFPENIHPEKQGKAHFLRAECQDLLFQLDSMGKYKRREYPFKLVQGGKACEPGSCKTS